MKTKELKAINIMHRQGREILKNQLNKIIFGPGINTYNRFPLFLKVADQLHGWQYWYLLRSAYEGSHGLYIYREQIKKAFLKNEPEQRTLMTIAERKIIKSLGSRITIYRGISTAEAESGDLGVSWNLSAQKIGPLVSNFYRCTLRAQEMTVISLDVNVSDIIAYFRGNEEIIYIENP